MNYASADTIMDSPMAAPVEQRGFKGLEDGVADLAQTTDFSISVIVPVFNSQEILPVLITRLEPVLKSLSQCYELVLVNDGSGDDSWKIIEKVSRSHKWIRGINLMRNYGQHNALLCGMRAARNAIVVTMDDDLQNPPEEIPKLITKLSMGYDVVYGATPSGRQGLWRQLASRITRWVLRQAMQVDAARDVSAFRVIRSEACQPFLNYQSPFVSVDVLLSWATNRFSAVPVTQERRHSGASNYTFGKLLSHAITMITGFSTLPLRFASLVGLCFTGFGMMVLAYVLGRYVLQGAKVPGFPFLASTIAIFSGAQLFALGVIGEYLARLYLRMMERPPYVVRQKSGRCE